MHTAGSSSDIIGCMLLCCRAAHKPTAGQQHLQTQAAGSNTRAVSNMLSFEKLGTTGGHGYTLHKQSSRHTTKPVHVARPYQSKSSSNGNASTGASNTDGNLQPAAAGAANKAQQRPAPSAELPTSLNLAFESMEKSSKAVKTTGLRRAPLSGGVKNATQRFDLPSPCVAVRNLVEQAQFAHLCTVMSHMHHRWAWLYRRCALPRFSMSQTGFMDGCVLQLSLPQQSKCSV
jgi:hypothetical protein